MWCFVAGFSALFFALALASAREAVGPDMERIAAAGGRAEPVTVNEVLSRTSVTTSSGGHVNSSVKVDLRTASGTVPAEGIVRHSRPAPGDQVWAFHAPGKPQAGVVLYADRSELDEALGESGASVAWAAVGVPVAMIALFVAPLWYPRPPYGHRTGGRSTKPLRSLRVRVTGARIGSHQELDSSAKPKRNPTWAPVLELESRSGEPLQLITEAFLDADRLKQFYGGAPGTVLWGERARGVVGDCHHAMVALDNGRFASGRLLRPDGSVLPAGTIVEKGAPLPIPGDLRCLPPATVWQPGVESSAAWVLVPGLLALCALAFGVTGVWPWVCAAVAAGSVVAAPFLVHHRRQQTLRVRADEQRARLST